MSFTYLQEQEEVSSEVYCWDTDPCALLKSNPIAERYCCNGNGTESCLDSQSGMTCAPSTESPGGAKSMSCAEDFRVKTSAQPAGVLELAENEADYGEKWHGYVAKYDPNTSSWKTRQCSLFEDLEPSLETWPSWGMMQGGECWEVRKPETRTKEPECGWLPTPIKGDFRFYRHTIAGARRKKFTGHGQTHIIHEASENVEMGDSERILANPQFNEQIMSWPIAWTDLRPLGTDRIAEWLRLHGKS